MVVRIGGTNDISQSQSHSVLEWGAAHSDDLWRVQADRRLSDGVSPTPVPGPAPVVPSAIDGEPVVQAPAEPTPSPVPVPPPVVTAVQPATDIERILCSKPWSCGTIIRIAWCESKHNPASVGRGSYGLLQIQASVWAHFFPGFWDTWMDPVSNVEMAWVIYQRAGYSFRPWSCW